VRHRQQNSLQLIDFIGLIVNRYSRRPSRGDCKGLSENLPIVKVHLVPNPHPFQVNSGIGLLRAFEGFGFVRDCPLPDDPFVGSRPVFGSRAGNGFDALADQSNDWHLTEMLSTPYAREEVRLRFWAL
jgi:hypothetical protein